MENPNFFKEQIKENFYFDFYAILFGDNILGDWVNKHNKIFKELYGEGTIDKHNIIKTFDEKIYQRTEFFTTIKNLMINLLKNEYKSLNPNKENIEPKYLITQKVWSKDSVAALLKDMTANLMSKFFNEGERVQFLNGVEVSTFMDKIKIMQALEAYAVTRYITWMHNSKSALCHFTSKSNSEPEKNNNEILKDIFHANLNKIDMFSNAPSKTFNKN